MRKTSIQKIEEFYNMPFHVVMQKEHIDKKISLKSMSKQCGVSRPTITKLADDMGIKRRSLNEAAKLTKNKGKNHWAYGQTKETHEKHRIQSDRMKKNNAIKYQGASERRAITMQDILKERNLPQELKFEKILESLNIEFEAQNPFGPYNLDFYIPSKNIAIEIDSTGKWGVDRREKSEDRDLYLFNNFKIKTIRINKDKLHDIDFIKSKLAASAII